MSQITGLIDGTNINHDYQISSIGNTLLNQGVISGLLVSTNSVAAGSGYIKCVRTNGQEIFVHYLNTAAVTITTSGTKKVWIGVDQSVIDNGSGNALDGTGIATIQTGASYPAGNYIPLASITGGVITDDRVFISQKAMVSKGYGVNKTKRINRTTGDEEIKGVTDGSTILDTDKIRLEKATGEFEDFSIPSFRNALNSTGRFLQNVLVGETLGSGISAMAIVDNIKYLPSGLTVNAGSFVRQGIRFTVPYNCTLGVVKSWVNASSGSAVIELRDDTGTLITSQTVTSGTNSAIFNQALTAGVTYRLVLNDTVNFTSNGYRVAVATFQAGFPYAVGGTTNGTNDATYCWSFSEININFGGKAFKARADRYIEKEFAYIAGFVTGPKAISDPIVLDNNAGTFVTGFTGLTADTEYYVSNTAGAIASTPGTVFSKVGIAKGTTGILIDKEYVVFDETITNTVANSTQYTTSFTGARKFFAILFSFGLDTNSAGGGGIQIEGETLVSNNTYKRKFHGRTGHVARGYATNTVGNTGASGRIQVFYYD